MTVILWWCKIHEVVHGWKKSVQLKRFLGFSNRKWNAAWVWWFHVSRPMLHTYTGSLRNVCTCDCKIQNFPLWGAWLSWSNSQCADSQGVSDKNAFEKSCALCPWVFIHWHFSPSEERGRTWSTCHARTHWGGLDNSHWDPEILVDSCLTWGTLCLLRWKLFVFVWVVVESESYSAVTSGSPWKADYRGTLSINSFDKAHCDMCSTGKAHLLYFHKPNGNLDDVADDPKVEASEACWPCNGT